MRPNHAPIGIFDSGVGGLSVLSALREARASENLLYVADQANVPYGARPLDEIRFLAEGITEYLLSQEVKLIVVACNTASAAALHLLREKYPSVPFVGMEPALKPAAGRTRSGKVGVLATEGTFQGGLYSSLLERFGAGLTVYEDSCPGLVDQIEAGALEEAKTAHILRAALAPMLEKGIDTVVLGCTHYPFVIPQIEAIVGPGVQVIDPAPAVARQAIRRLEREGWGNAGPKTGWLRLATSSVPERLETLLPRLLGWDLPVEGLLWMDGVLEHRSK